MIRGALSGLLVGTMRRRGASFGPGSGVGGGLSAALDLNFTSGTLDSRVTYTGASLATLTDATGAIAYKPHNLLTYSEDFTNAAWSKTGVSVSSQVLTVSASGGSKSIVHTATIPAGAACFAVKVRAVSSSRFAFGVYNAGFLANTCTVVSGPGTITGTTLRSLAGLSTTTWTVVYISITAPASATDFYVYPGADSSGTNSVGDSIELAYAQLNVGPLQPYYPTTSAAYYGPRFTYDPVTHAALGLLIEGQRTNLLLWSRDFSSAAWTKQASASTAVRNAVGVDGIASSASTITESAGYFARSVYQPVTGSSGAYSTSVSFQQAAGPTRYLRITVVSGPSDFGYVTVNLKTGAIAQAAAAIGTASAASATVTYQPSTGMWRVSLSCTLAAAPTFVFFVPIDATPVVVAGDYGRDSYTGDGSTSWVLDAAQFEPGAFATTPIHTTSASVTRAADSATMTGSNFSSWFNATQGTLALNWNPYDINGTPVGVAFSLPSTFNNVPVYAKSTGEARAYNGTTVIQTVNTIAAGTLRKQALAYTASTRAIVLNGSSVVTDAAVPFDTSPTSLSIGASPNLSNQMSGVVNRLRYYNTALTNAQLQALTT